MSGVKKGKSGPTSGKAIQNVKGGDKIGQKSTKK